MPSPYYPFMSQRNKEAKKNKINAWSQVRLRREVKIDAAPVILPTHNPPSQPQNFLKLNNENHFLRVQRLMGSSEENSI